ncbi:hypothetical protein AQJ67_25270 [Streptomyces caeruleatus]|uniref:Lipoprotein n=1 Tax=Streptomyces caeruleatus TaxID=661399 RepID=A0A101TWL0_9ACTN|nr:hypothetical protein AQJ67_25270 [Streptomyces caeruleatus]
MSMVIGFRIAAFALPARPAVSAATLPATTAALPRRDVLLALPLVLNLVLSACDMRVSSSCSVRRCGVARSRLERGEVVRQPC